jgi:hypothetical protein
MAQNFTIDIPQFKIDLLHKKLHLATFPDELHPDPAWDQGTPLSEVTRLADKWKDWDWRRAEKDLNKYPQFTTKIDVEEFGELDIHFLHEKSTVEKAIPLLFVHGCTTPIFLESHC